MSFAACEVPMPLLGCLIFFSLTTYIKKNDLFFILILILVFGFVIFIF